MNMKPSQKLVKIEFKVLLVLVPIVINSVASQNYSSSLFVASKALSTSNWELYKTESQPSSDLIQCLARCELHPEYYVKDQNELISQLFFWRCNAVSFESNLCEEASVMELEDINFGESEKDFLIRSDEVR